MPARPPQPPASNSDEEPPEDYGAARRKVLENLDPEERRQLVEAASQLAADAPLPDAPTASRLRHLLLRTWPRRPR